MPTLARFRFFISLSTCSKQNVNNDTTSIRYYRHIACPLPRKKIIRLYTPDIV